MAGTGTSSPWRALFRALPLVALGGLVALVAFRVSKTQPTTPVEPTKDAPPTPRPPRVRTIDKSAPPPAKAVRVAVTSMDGKPIAGARVELVRGPDAYERDFLPRAKAPAAGIVAEVDGAGLALAEDVPRGNWFVVADAPGFGRHALAGVVRGDDDVGVDATVALDVGHSLNGTVRDADGGPASGVAVVLAPRVDFVNDAICLRTTTGADGSYRFEGLESGRYLFWYAVHDDVLAEAADLLVPGVEAFDVRIARGAAIEGAVTDADSGAPVGGARVVAIQYVESGISGVEGRTDVLDAATTDRLGRFALRTWRPTCAVTSFVVDASGYAPTPVDASPPSGSVSEGQRFIVDLSVRREAAVHGVVIGPDGPMAGLVVAARLESEGVTPYPDGRRRAVRTAADGTFRIAGLPAGEASLLVAFADGGDVLAQTNVELEATCDVEHDVKLDVRRVRLKRGVHDAAGAPIAGAEVTQRLGPWRARGVSDAQGVVELDVVFAGEMPAQVVLRAKGFRELRTHVGEHDGDEAFPPLRRGDELAGRVVRFNETGAAGVRLVVHGGVIGVEGQTWWDWGATRETVTDADGAFRLPALGGLRHAIGAPHIVGVNPIGGDEVDEREGPIEMRFHSDGPVSGRVVAAGTDDPIAGASIVVSDSIVVARTGADGRFAVDLPFNVALELSAVAPGRQSARVRWETPDQHVELCEAARLSGVVRFADGTPVPGLRLRATRKEFLPDERWKDVFTSATDASGRFAIDGLDGGANVVWVADHATHRLAAMQVTANAPGQLDLVVRPGVTLAVEFADADGSPPAEGVGLTNVRAEEPDAAWDSECVTMVGRVEFTVAAGVKHTVRVECHGYEPIERTGVVAGDKPLRVVLQKQPR